MKPKALKLSISAIDPPLAHAGEREQWTVRVGGLAMAAGTRVKLVLSDAGSDASDWGVLQVDDEHEEGYVTAQGPEGLTLSLKAPDWGEAGETAVVVTIGEPGLKKAEALAIVLGDTSQGGPGLQAQTFTQLRKTFGVFIATVRGKWREAEPSPVLKVEGGPADRVQVFMPGTAQAGERFEALVKAEDHHGNRAGFYQGIIGLHGEGGRAGLPDEVVVSPRDESSLTVRGMAPRGENLSFRIRAEDLRSGDRYLSNAVLVLGDEDPYNLYWGVLHGRTELSDGVGTPEEYFACLRDENRLDFGALGDPMPNDETWQRAAKAVADANEPEKFVTLPGYGWEATERKGDGDRSVLYLDDERRPCPSDGDNCPRPHDLFRLLHERHLRKAIAAPRHTAWAGNPCDFTEHDPVHERLIGIYSALGCSERSIQDGNALPMRPPGMPDGGEVLGLPIDAGEAPEGVVQRALALGWRVGFLGGADDRHGHPGDATKTGPEPFRYRDGLVGVWATELTRASIWDALWNRRTVASTGPRIVLRWQMGEHLMGEDVEARAGEGIMAQRLINIEAHGQSRIVTVEIVRNNEVVHSERPGTHDAAVSWADEEPFDAFALRPLSGRAPFAFYYVRVLQDDGEMAWASPIWLTLAP